MSLTISMDDTLKTEFSEVCAEIGMSASTAMNVFAKKVVREGRIPFELTVAPDEGRRYGFSSRERDLAIAEALVRSYEDARAGRTYSMEDLRERHEGVRQEVPYA